MKKIALSLVALIACICIFIVGFQFGASKIEREYQIKTSYLDVMNAIASYSIQADVAQAVNEKQDSKALCLIQLQASAHINKVRSCLENASCRHVAEPEILKMAPEFLGKGELRIKYYKEGEICK